MYFTEAGIETMTSFEHSMCPIYLGLFLSQCQHNIFINVFYFMLPVLSNVISMCPDAED
jgi:hypothetical protein